MANYFSRLLSCLILYVLLSTLIYFFVPNQQAHLEIDSHGYDRIAYNFAQYNILVDPYNQTGAPIQPIGYPFFVGIIYKLFGHFYAPVVIIQIMLGLLCGLLLFLITIQLFDVHVACITLFLLSINVGFLVYPQFILAEMLVMFFLLLFWWLFLPFVLLGRMHKDNRSFPLKYNIINDYRIVLSGLCIGLSIIIKPAALLFIPFAVIILFFVTTRQRFKITALFVGAAYAPVLLYMLYNYYWWGAFAVAPLTSLNLYHVFFSKVLAQLHGGSPQHYMQTVLQFTGMHSFDEAGWDNAKTFFFVYIKQEPLVFITVWLKNVAKTIFGLFTTQLKVLLEPTLHGGDCSFFKLSGDILTRIITYIRCGTSSMVLQAIGLYEAWFSLLRLFVMPVGLFVLIKKRTIGIAILLCLFITQSVIITGFDGCARYRLIIEPFLLMLTAAGLWYLYRNHYRRYKKGCNYIYK